MIYYKNKGSDIVKKFIITIAIVMTILATIIPKITIYNNSFYCSLGEMFYIRLTDNIVYLKVDNEYIVTDLTIGDVFKVIYLNEPIIKVGDENITIQK